MFSIVGMLLPGLSTIQQAQAQGMQIFVAPLVDDILDDVRINDEEEDEEEEDDLIDRRVPISPHSALQLDLELAENVDEEEEEEDESEDNRIICIEVEPALIECFDI